MACEDSQELVESGLGLLVCQRSMSFWHVRLGLGYGIHVSCSDADDFSDSYHLEWLQHRNNG